jgi:probable phosphoglycerate mutase
MKKVTALSSVIVVVLLAIAVIAEAQQAIFLVRHADTVRQQGNPDMPLSDAGQRRAAALAALLKDSGINTIYTTGMQRTIQTAAPLAKLLRIEPKVLPQLNPGYKQNDVDNLANLLRTEHRGDVVLVVLHSTSGPALIKALGYSTEIKIPETEFDNLFVIVPKGEGSPTLLRLRY